MTLPITIPEPPQPFKYASASPPRLWIERLMAVVLAIAGTIPIAIVGTITVVFAYQSWLFFRQVPWISFLSDTRWTPLFSSQQYGISVLLSATLIISAIALAVALPLGVLAAIYLSEYAPDWVQQILRPLLSTLAGIPTIAYGYFALLFVTPQLQRLLPQLGVFNSLSAGLVTGLLIIPIVAGLSEDALRAVPQVQRRAAYACGFTRQELITGLLLPATLPGIMAASMLAASRALGETMIAAVAAGQFPRLTLNPLVPVESMTAFIVQVSLGSVPTDSLLFHAIFTVGMTLFLLTLTLNSLGSTLIHRYRQGLEGQDRPQAALPGETPSLDQRPGPDLSLAEFCPHQSRRQWGDRLFHLLGLGATLVGPLCLLLLVLVTFRSGLPELDWQFLTSFSSRKPEAAGVLAGLAGTLWLLGLTTLLSVPLALGAAIYLEEYNRESRWSWWVEVNIANATAIPGILYGLLGLALFVQSLGWLTGGRTIISGALVMTLVVLPLLITASRTALRAVPRSLKKSAYALGMGRWQVTWHITLPAALPDLLTGLTLALSRTLGETAPLIALGTVEFVTFVPTPTGLRVPFSTLTTQLFFWLSRPQETFQAKAAAAIILLGMMVLALNLGVGMVRDRLRTSAP